MSWPVPATLDALKSILEARPALDGVTVFTGPPGDDAKFTDAFAFFGAEGDQEPITLSADSVGDSFRVFGSVFARKDGAGEVVTKAARDRAAALLAELEDTVSDDRTLGGVVIQAEVTALDLNQGYDPGVRWAEIRFQVNCEDAS